ncbi:hypothetical protein BCR44DRAFT_1437382 [Catenaria anguillulae PL171]|uniref:Uncharacterized protein n=1 Tax=Catenaria anguillulae PL171 TaxID=765915 RepID=A0A1Y2HJC7_9FUNG|nr:hypothetical protein BCR44DRAFT_1437382 [Catenaria anguillulae PL171]
MLDALPLLAALAADARHARPQMLPQLSPGMSTWAACVWMLPARSSQTTPVFDFSTTSLCECAWRPRHQMSDPTTATTWAQSRRRRRPRRR